MLNRNQFFNRIESLLLKVCIISLISVLVFQVFSANADLIVFNSNKKLNSVGYKNIQKGIIILKIIDNTSNYDDIDVLINGNNYGKFDKNGEIKLFVYNNDIIEVYSNSLIKIKIVGVSKNIASPKLDTIINMKHNIELVGKVIISST